MLQVRKIPRGLIVTTALALGLLPAFSIAQESTEKLNEIVVTAQKREQNLQDVGTSVTAFDMISAEGRRKLAKIPIYIVIGDHAQDRVDASRKFQQEMASIGGHVTVDVLPEAGIYGNGHTMMLEKNNKQIMYRMIAWLEGNVFRPK